MARNLELPPMIPELCVSNVDESLAFYVNLLGFRVVYQRPEDRFAMIERQDSFLMLDEIVPGSKRTWIAGPLEKPFGRGINLSIETDDAAGFSARLQRAGVFLFLPLEEKWYRADDVYLGVRQFIVLDPDGYMLRFSESLGSRLNPPET